MSKLQIYPSTVKDIITAAKQKTQNSSSLRIDQVAEEIEKIPSINTNDIFYINSFENLDHLEITHYGTQVSLNTNATQGNYSARMDLGTTIGNVGKAGAMFKQRPSQPIDLSKYEYIQFDLYISKAQSGSQFQVNFSSEMVSSNLEDGYNWLVGTERAPGWYRFKIKKDGINNPITADWSKISLIRFTYYNTSQTEPDGLYFLLDNLIAY